MSESRLCPICGNTAPADKFEFDPGGTLRCFACAATGRLDKEVSDNSLSRHTLLLALYPIGLCWLVSRFFPLILVPGIGLAIYRFFVTRANVEMSRKTRAAILMACAVLTMWMLFAGLGWIQFARAGHSWFFGILSHD
jgi:hypothetical protein